MTRALKVTEARRKGRADITPSTLNRSMTRINPPTTTRWAPCRADPDT